MSGQKQKVFASEAMDILERKTEHIQICTTMEVEAKDNTLWNDIHLVHECLPELDRDEIDLSVELLGHRFDYPFFITALTGGPPQATIINENLARAAEHFNIGLELGSQRVLLNFPEVEPTFSIARKVAPQAFLVANIGTTQLIDQPNSPAYTVDQIESIIDTVKVNALAIHLNFLQEAVMFDGDTKATGCLKAIGEIAHSVSVPVIVKETGAGISKSCALRFEEQGISALELGGAGGTSMALVESHRAALHHNPKYERLGKSFASWGIPTPISIVETRDGSLPIIASGGIRTGLDAAKAFALGADLVGVARPLLCCALEGPEAVMEWLEVFFAELSVALFLSGASSIKEMKQKRMVIVGRMREWLQQLGYEKRLASKRQ